MLQTKLEDTSNALESLQQECEELQAKLVSAQSAATAARQAAQKELLQLQAQVGALPQYISCLCH